MLLRVISTRGGRKNNSFIGTFVEGPVYVVKNYVKYLISLLSGKTMICECVYSAWVMMNSGRATETVSPVDDYALEGNDTGFKENGCLHEAIETNTECSICGAVCY